MAKYKLLAPSIVNNVYCETGTIVDIGYMPGPQMEPLDAEGRRKLKEFEESRAELEPDYPNHGWPIIDRLWHGSLVRERLRELRSQRDLAPGEGPPAVPPRELAQERRK